MSTELVRRNDVVELIVAKKQSIIDSCNKHVDPLELYKSAQFIVSKDTKLQECTPLSVLQCVVSAAQMGLRLNTFHGHAYLIPRKGVCTLQVGYRGLLSLAWRSPALESINAFTVWKQDRFEVRYGSSAKIIHHPNMDGPCVDADITHAYATCMFRGKPMFRVLTRKRLNEIAKTSYTDGDYYRKHYSEWCCARAIKSLMKWLPLDGEAESNFSRLNEIDDTVNTEAVLLDEPKLVENRAAPKLEGVVIQKHEDDAEFVNGVTALMEKA